MKLISISRAIARPHHDCSAEHANTSAEPISKVRRLTFDLPSPEHGNNDKNSTISGVYPTEGIALRLEDGNNPVKSKQNETDHSKHYGPLLPKPQPDEVSTTNFENPCGKEKHERSHATTLRAMHVTRKCDLSGLFSALFSESGTLSLGDWGTESLKCFFGGLAPVPMLALPLFSSSKNCKTNTKNTTNKEKNMNNKNYQSDHGVSYTPNILQIILTLSIFLFVTGCSLQVHKRDLIQNVLNRENDLIEKLENERHDPIVEAKLKKDEHLWKAEMHLREAIKALKNANDVVKETL